MVDTAISGLPAATTVDAAADYLPIVQGGATLKAPAGLIRPAYRGAHVTLSGVVTNPASPYFVAWGTEVLDTDGFWAIGNPSRMTIPAGVSRVRLYYGLTFSLSTWTAGSSVSIGFRKNGAGSTICGLTVTAGYTDPLFSVVSPPLAVSAADYFEARLVSTDATFTIAAADATYFALEVVT
jgi:hypothetical protein